MDRCEFVALGLVILASTGCARSEQPPAADAATRVTALADAYVKEYFDAFPYEALASGAPDVHPDELADRSLGALKRWQDREDAFVGELGAIDVASLEGQPEEITAKFLQNQLESAQAFRVCRMELWNVSPTYTGWQGEFPLVAGQQPTTTEEERRHAVARFSRLPAYIDTEIENLQEGLRLGYTAPRHNVRVVIEQMDALLSGPVPSSPFVQMGDKDEAIEFWKQLEELETTGIRPAITRYRDFLRDMYLPKARESIGVGANPNGGACYAAAVRRYATVEMTPQAIHDLGKAQLATIRAEMEEIGRPSFGVTDPAKLLALVKKDARYRFKSREELIKYAEAAIDRARKALPAAFGRLPTVSVVIEPYPPFLEKSAPGGQYMSPSAGGKPGKYMLNAYNAAEQSTAGLESTAFHETYPGHHLQVAIALERKELHPISRYFNLSGFGEGWGLYAERLADELKLFSSDVDRLGLLSNEALRAARLVVDSGMHALGWSRQQAIDYLRANTTETEARAEAEIDRYIAVPGQATAYMIGNLEIRKLRTEAQQALGASFDLRAFHDRVLEDGAVPLGVLREKIERWIKERHQ